MTRLNLLKRIEPWISVPILFLLMILSGCTEEQPVKLGFIGGLTGRTADLGMAGRDGATLAVEQINRKGGVNGQRVELLIADDQQKAEVARSEVTRLIDEEVFAIVGPMTSSMALATVPIINKKQVLMMSPTVSTNELNGRRDHFMRVYPSSAIAAKLLAEYLAIDLDLKHLMAVYNIDNRAHTESWLEHFESEYVQRGGVIVSALPYSSNETSFHNLALTVAKEKKDVLFVLANAIDTALLMQNLAVQGQDLPVFVTEWSATEQLVESAGKSAEGVRFFHTFDRNSDSFTFQKFSKAFEERFGYRAGFASMHAYDATRILIKAFQAKVAPMSLAETVLAKKVYYGAQGKLTFDDYGDVIRPHYLMTVREGDFVVHEN